MKYTQNARGMRPGLAAEPTPTFVGRIGKFERNSLPGLLDRQPVQTYPLATRESRTSERSPVPFDLMWTYPDAQLDETA